MDTQNFDMDSYFGSDQKKSKGPVDLLKTHETSMRKAFTYGMKKSKLDEESKMNGQVDDEDE